MARALIASAFGPDATLYDALDADKSASQAELKKAFRRRALQFHPDRHIGRASSSLSTTTDGNDDDVGDGAVSSENAREKRIDEATLKFQAVSAAYEILMDPGRRSDYDRTGRMGSAQMEEEDDDTRSAGSCGGRRASGGGRSGGSAKANQRRWEEFFRSVFDKVASAGAKYGKADAYRGSKEEADEVLRHYRMCKGDMDRVVDCVVHGGRGDKERWMRRIVVPAIRRGEVEDYCGVISKPSAASGDGLVDSDDDDEDRHKKKRGRKTGRLTKAKKLGKRKRPEETSKNLKKKRSDQGLLDTDDADEAGGRQKPSSQAQSKQLMSGSHPAAAMSKKDKLAYRVAKKRKQRAEREIELTEIIQSKRWSGAADGGGGGIAAAAASRRNARSGTFSDSLISSLERKYSSGGLGKKMRR